jgi:hypothetical protein
MEASFKAKWGVDTRKKSSYDENQRVVDESAYREFNHHTNKYITGVLSIAGANDVRIQCMRRAEA